ncbi:MAG: UDP-3-O-acyl-N-acetylglucosamine deacetylase [Nitrospirota bacterium]|nr:UDP-3-O-acyl-N-acetylglucosamine deacetylase [Nitrospirota bacterium]
MSYQNTVSKEARFTGVGLHTGASVTLSVRPAPVDAGLRFVVGRPGAEPVVIDAHHANIQTTSYATSLGSGDLRLHTVEHLLAALSGLGVDNAELWLDGPEVPVMDGSARPFVEGLLQAGLVEQPKARRVIRITQPIRVADGDKWIELLPSVQPGLQVDYAIDFEHLAIGRQHFHMKVTPETFEKEIAAARTFGFAHEVARMQSAGLARGASLDNAVAVGDEGVLNPGGLRFDDEMVRHKVLDLVGDLALLGRPLWGHLIANRAGHGMHARLMEEILLRTDRWESVIDEPLEAVRLTASQRALQVCV